MQQAAACPRCGADAARLASSTKLAEAQPDVRKLFRRIFFTLAPSDPESDARMHSALRLTSRDLPRSGACLDR
jgi:hypothetical protein